MASRSTAWSRARPAASMAIMAGRMVEPNVASMVGTASSGAALSASTFRVRSTPPAIGSAMRAATAGMTWPSNASGAKAPECPPARRQGPGPMGACEKARSPISRAASEEWQRARHELRRARERLLGHDPRRRRVHRLHPVDQDTLAYKRATGSGSASGHVVRVEGAAVVEAHPLAPAELPGKVAYPLPARGRQRLVVGGLRVAVDRHGLWVLVGRGDHGAVQFQHDAVERAGGAQARRDLSPASASNVPCSTGPEGSAGAQGIGTASGPGTPSAPAIAVAPPESPRSLAPRERRPARGRVEGAERRRAGREPVGFVLEARHRHPHPPATARRDRSGGRGASKARAARSTRSSRWGAAKTCSPTGRRGGPGASPQGTEIADCPVVSNAKA